MRYDSAKRSSFLLTIKTVANGCSLFLVGLLSRKPLSTKHRSTFLPLQHADTLIYSVDSGLASHWLMSESGATQPPNTQPEGNKSAMTG